MRNSYTDILQYKIEIPIIQRDYAQGRTDSKTAKIRKDFLDVLFEFIVKKQASDLELELDFIYGFNEEDRGNHFSFIPIDGQQRLTTLWLLYWFISAKENVPKEEKTFLSNFVYETRHSTTVFCEKLMLFTPEFLNENISSEIKNQPWYFETWDYDPSIQAMLVVLSDIENRYHQIGFSVWNMIKGTNCPFYFYKLNMEKVGLSDDLYIKMNSRGKALTEFEYFKAGFSDILTDPNQKERFEKSIDQNWTEAIWNIVLESIDLKNDDDIAAIVDSCFLNLFNFITSVIAYKNNLRYKDTVVSSDLLKIIYSDSVHQEILFSTLDAICEQQAFDADFWTNTFYYAKDDFNASKTRLFFLHKEVNLLKRCLFQFSENRGLTYSEQLLLHACFTFFRTQNGDFENHIRVVRNLAINSENELRESILGNSFREVEDYIENGDLAIYKNFKTDQIEEERNKEQFLKQLISEVSNLKKLEDSDLLRGSVSLFPLDSSFGSRSEQFLELFDEIEMGVDFNVKSKLLLCFGDYSQADGDLTNLMSSSITVIRSFLTSPGFNKEQFYSNTQIVLMDCLDFFVANPTISVGDKINEQLRLYGSTPKDWKYYFLKYDSFRTECTRGYYKWLDGDYIILKMRVRQLNGYHWDPFLFELRHDLNSDKLFLDNYRAKLLISINSNKISVSTIQNGFLFENENNNDVSNTLFDGLVNSGMISNSGEYLVPQNDTGMDLEDRLEGVKQIIVGLLNL